jgi:hypothetical protein
MSDVDGGVRRLVLAHGREMARTMVDPEQRPLVDIAAEVMGDDAHRIGITYTGFCLTSLPVIAHAPRAGPALPATGCAGSYGEISVAPGLGM